MRRIYKYLFMFTFVISSFLFISDIKADYNATVINPSGASCSLKDSSTGFCYYENSNLNSLGDIWYLDTGDQVTVLTNYSTIPTKDSNLCPDYYVYTSFYFSNTRKTYYGYYCNAYLSTGALTNELKEEFRNKGFPESYWERLAILKTAHPNWTFKAINTYLDFNAAVTGESERAGWSLIRLSTSNNYAYLKTDATSFDYRNDRFIPYDDIYSSNAWYNANYDTVAYYMDPRNFLSDMHIFQFEGLSYDDSISDDSFRTTINSLFSNDYMIKFTEDFITAGKESRMSPVYLAALSKQEVGNGSTPGTAISGTYNGMYNFYNIGATGGADPVYNGLSFAANSDTSTLRPWNTEYNAIVGGALWMAEKYVAVGQDTSFFKKWNVIYNYLIETGKVSNPYYNFQHQYMTNIMAPSSEATTTYQSYYNSGMIDLNFIFYIPVYSSMPSRTTLPTQGGWPNNYLTSISINGSNIAGFDGEVEVYNYNLDINDPVVKIESAPVSSSAKIEGNGTFEITDDTTKTIKVTAENGKTKTYKINISLVGTKLENPIDVVTTLNNAGIKNGDKYLSGFTIGSDISFIRDRILNTNKDTKLTLKNSGIMVTGDTVKITVGSETREYEVVIYGDVNGDGKISAVDYVRIKNNIMGTSSLNGVYKEAADVDRNGKVSAVDYVKIKNQIMGNGSIIQ